MGEVAIVGLGDELAESIPEPVLTRLRNASSIVVPGEDGAADDLLNAAGASATSFGELGITPSSPPGFVVDRLRELASDGDVVLISPGFPMMREGVISGLLGRVGSSVDVLPAASTLGVLMLALDIDLSADLDIVDVERLTEAGLRRDAHLIVTGVRNSILARKAAQRLLEAYPAAHPVIVAAVREGGFELSSHMLSELGSGEFLAAENMLFLAPTRPEPPGTFDELVRILAVLRGPHGCPWDLEQTPMTLREHLIEEAYEVVGAVEAGDAKAIAEELGDLLLQVVFQAQMASEEEAFDIDDVTAGIVTKLRRRHPHIFGTGAADSAAAVAHEWDRIKRAEKDTEHILDDVPLCLPSLALAQKISNRVAGVGFDWESVEDVWEKVHEEIDELKAARKGTQAVADEVGDVLFTVVSVARKLGVDAEIALRDACARFRARFDAMEDAAGAQGAPIASFSLDELERLWQDAKAKERQGREGDA